MDALEASNWAAAACLAAPHLLYAYIWFLPKQWQAIFKKRSVETFETVAWLLKILQALAVAYWWLLRKPAGLDLAAVPLAAWPIGLGLAAFGQWLNIGIFQAIGHAGVYYGFKLGHTIPWVDGFPFNVVSHPQYVGSVATILGAAVLVWSQAPAGLGAIVAYWVCLYIATGFQESKLHVE